MSKKNNMKIGAVVIIFLAIAAFFAIGGKLPFQANPTSSCTVAQKNFVDCNAYYNDKRVQCSVISGASTGTWYSFDTCPSGQICDDSSTASIKPCKSASTVFASCPDSYCESGNGFSGGYAGVWYVHPTGTGGFAFNINGQVCRYSTIKESCTSTQTCAGLNGCQGSSNTCPATSCQNNYNGKTGSWVYSNPTTSGGLSVPVSGQTCYFSSASYCGNSISCDSTGHSCATPLCTLGDWRGSTTCNSNENAVYQERCMTGGATSLQWISSLKQQCSSTHTCTFGTCINNAPTPYCGDGACNNGETCSTCQSDCGSCTPTTFCGNGACDGSDTCSSCPNDCGACPVQPVYGCTDATATNYNSAATGNDGSCQYPVKGCTSNSECSQGCGGVCASGSCQYTTAVPSPPCSGATYKNCAWDSSTCQSNINMGDLGQYAPYIVVVVLVVLIVAVAMRRRK